MHTFVRPMALTSVFAILAGCMGGGDPSDITNPNGPNALNIGTRSTTASPSGIPFAGTETLETLSGTYPLVGRLVRFESDWPSRESVIVVNDETLQLDFSTDNGFVQSITLNGQTYALVWSEVESAYVADLPNGQRLFVAADGRTDFVGFINVYTYSDTLAAGFDTDGYIVLGLQTNPDLLPMTTGTVTYTGEIFGYGNRFDQDNGYLSDSEPFSGSTEIDVRFADAEIASTYLELQLVDVASAPQVFFVGDGASIVGNGFADDMSIIQGACPDLTTCSGTVRIGGAFFGNNAQELAGNLGVDYTIIDTVSGDGERFIGAGAFVAEPPAP